jgi:hypothetical protein
VPRGEPFEHVRAERRRSGDGDPHAARLCQVTVCYLARWSGGALRALPCAPRRPCAGA